MTTENPLDKVKMTDLFATEPLDMADPKNESLLKKVLDYQRERRRIFIEENKGKGRVKKEQPINEVMDKKL